MLPKAFLIKILNSTLNLSTLDELGTYHSNKATS